MESMERMQAKSTPEIMLPRSQEPEKKKLLDIVAEQVAVMGREETREMLAFMRGMKFARAMDSGAM